uniref:Uncharacterized protein n=1 Tax=Oryza meridionalis TaxID=40149 RepID=A0A0E0D3R6_9ORYZ
MPPSGVVAGRLRVRDSCGMGGKEEDEAASQGKAAAGVMVVVRDGCVGLCLGIASESLARPWAGMTTTTSLGAVPLLGGVVLALTPPSTKTLCVQW